MIGGQILKFAHHKSRTLRFGGLVSTVACLVLSGSWLLADQDPSQEAVVHFPDCSAGSQRRPASQREGIKPFLIFLPSFLVLHRVFQVLGYAGIPALPSADNRSIEVYF